MAYWVDDTFTGDDGAAADPVRWLNQSNNGWIISSNRISNTCDDWEQLKSRYMLVGDFDLQIDFDFTNMMRISAHTAMVFLQNVDDTKSFFVGQQYYSGRKYTANYKDTSWGSQQYVSTSDTSGSYRMVRSGNTITVYYWNGSSWASLQNHNFGSAPDLYVILVHWSPSGAAVAYFDNFKLNSGTVSLSLSLTSGPKMDLAVQANAFDYFKMLLEVTAGEFTEDFSLNLDVTAQTIDSFKLMLEVGMYTLEDFKMLLEVTDGTVFDDFALLLEVADGTVFDNFKMDLRVISATPAFRSVTAHRVSSVISEVV